ELRLVITRAMEQRALKRQCQTLRNQLDSRYSLGSVVGHDYKMLRVYDLIDSVAESKVNVLIEGESGTGKSLIARAIHYRSERSREPFVEVSCGAIPETLLESELFGHVRGAFTGAVSDKPGRFKAADGGTIFLDEISAASPALQVKLLRVLQEREFVRVGGGKTYHIDVRVVTATNQDLERAVSAKAFREDVYYRLNVIPVHLPPLRERKDDIPLLIDLFIMKFREKGLTQLESVRPDALAALQAYGRYALFSLPGLALLAAAMSIGPAWMTTVAAVVAGLIYGGLVLWKDKLLALRP
ncbi:MAG: sigma-54-dependent Fis family transcriptional regulator, partial [Bacteroidetes bacterium]|nr:sigma-54-dependent Fis family transcriptional regulator [Bacteroidota bacterium]